jgi:SAM-dependent methyltransferase
MNENKNHWYDGWFYDIFIAPNQDRLFRHIGNLIEADSTIIDVGCGTGRFSFFIADKCKSVLGIDLSERNISRADQNLSKYSGNKISFRHTSLSQLASEKTEHFDYAVMTYVLHEIDQFERIKNLEYMSDIADKIIIGDYAIPNKTGFWNILNEAVEFAAGQEHYHNYKSFLANGGTNNLATEAGLKLNYEQKDNPSTSHLVLLTK